MLGTFIRLNNRVLNVALISDVDLEGKRTVPGSMPRERDRVTGLLPTEPCVWVSWPGYDSDGDQISMSFVGDEAEAIRTFFNRLSPVFCFYSQPSQPQIPAESTSNGG